VQSSLLDLGAHGKAKARESVEQAFEALLREKEAADSTHWQKLAENKRQKWQLWKAKGSMSKWKAAAALEGVSTEAIAGVIQSVELRSSWDTSLHSYKVLQKVNDSPPQAYLHMVAKGVMQMQDREMVQFRTVRTMTDGSVRIVYQGCTHGRAPESDRIKRAECILSGFVLEPWKNEDGEDKGCKLFGYSHIEYRGSPALALLREWVKKGPQKWFSNLLDECKRWQAKGRDVQPAQTMEAIGFDIESNLMSPTSPPNRSPPQMHAIELNPLPSDEKTHQLTIAL